MLYETYQKYCVAQFYHLWKDFHDFVSILWEFFNFFKTVAKDISSSFLSISQVERSIFSSRYS